MPSSIVHPLKHGFGLGGWIPRALDPKAGLPDLGDPASDAYWMGRALVKAMDAVGIASPNPSVGAILCKDGATLGSGATEAYGGRHAERVALDEAGQARSASCYVTLEPCALPGKQPPCSDALIAAGIKRCIIGSLDPHPKASGLGLKRMRDASIEVVQGCLAAESMAWHFPFLAYQERNRPVLIGKWAQTLDGHLADDYDNSQWISGASSRLYTHWLRQKYDGIMVGAGTVLRDVPRLTARSLAASRQPHKIVYDPSGRLLQASAAVVAALEDELTIHGPLFYWCTAADVTIENSPFKGLADRVVLVKFPKGEPLSGLVSRLHDHHCQRFSYDMQSILVEGGAQLLTLLMREQLLDALHVFIRAGVLGGQKNRIGRTGRNDPSLTLMQRHDFRLLSSYQLDDDIVLECVHRRYRYWDSEG